MMATHAHKPLTRAELARYRAQLLQAGAGVAARLAHALADADLDAGDLPTEEGSGADADDRLRHLLDVIEAAIGRIDSGTYGVCLDCRAPLRRAALVATPWADRCGRCEVLDTLQGPPRAGAG
jgi:RNA polymerase-binding transcription factor DksA